MRFKFDRIILNDYDKTTLTAIISMWHNANIYRFDTLAATIAAEYNPIENYDRTETVLSTRTPNLTETLTHNTTQAQSGTTATTTAATVEESTNSTRDLDRDNYTSDDTDEDITVNTVNRVVPFDETALSGSDGYIREAQTVTTDRDTDRSFREDISENESVYGSRDNETHVTDTTTHGRQDKTTGTETTTNTGNEQTATSIRAHGNIGVTTVAEMLEQERTKTANFVLLDIYLADLINNISIGIYKGECI